MFIVSWNRGKMFDLCAVPDMLARQILNIIKLIRAVLADFIYIDR